MKNLIKSKHISLILFFLVLFLGAFLRFYRIREYMMFLGDEGRDVLVVKRMIVDHKFTLLGPITSVGSMYMGPIYYYFMTPFLWLWGFDPVGPAIMVALFSVFTIILLYKMGSDFFHPIVGLVSAFLYALSPLTIIYGRSSWNPNLVPFFSLLLMCSILMVIVKRHYIWLTIAGLSLGILFQLHYVTFIFIPIVLSCLAISRLRIPLRNIFYGFLAMVAAYSPFLLFEVRHQFINAKGVWRFLLEQRGSPEKSIISAFLNQALDVFIRVFWRLIVIESAELTKVFIFMLVVVLGIKWKSLGKNREKHLAVKIILLWLSVGVLVFGFYQGAIYDYYLGSLFPIPFILTGLVIYIVWFSYPMGTMGAIIALIVLGFFNLKNSPLKIAPNNLLKNTQEISRFVLEKTQGQSFNFALIALKNSDHAYRYFFEIWGRPPMVIETPDKDPERKTTTNQLLIVCEEKVCQPLGHPLWEIAGFGRAEIVGQWQVSTARVFKLEHYKEISTKLQTPNNK